MGTANRKLLSGVAAMIVVGLTAGLAHAAMATYGTLSSKKGEPSVYDWQLQQLIGKYFDNNDGMTDNMVGDNILLYFTECYGGDKLENFNNTTDDTPHDTFKFTNTSAYSANTAGKTSKYGGYHDDAATALVPGATSGDVHTTGTNGKAASETPVAQGPSKAVGGTNSTHVLIWSGQSNSKDEADLTDIIDSFQGQPNTTVHALANQANGGGYLPYNGVMIKDATLANLEAEIAAIDAMMGAGEQFILFVTDHGNIETVNIPDPLQQVIVPGDCKIYDINLPVSLLSDWVSDPANNPTLQLFVDPNAFSLFGPTGLSVEINNTPIDSFFDIFYQIEVDGSMMGVMQYTLPDESILQTGLGIVDDLVQSIKVWNNLLTGPTLNIYEVNIGSGDIAKVPEPTTIVLLGLSSIALLRRRA